MHPRISINTLCLGNGDLRSHVAAVTALGAGAISPGIGQVIAHGADSAATLLRENGLRVATLTHRAFGYTTADEAAAARVRLDTTIRVAATIGARTITLTTGGRGTLAWQDAAARFGEAIRPCAANAREAGVVLSLEPTSHLYADASIAHRLGDVVTLAQQAGIGVGIDLFAAWADSDIDAAIVAAGPRIALVQVSDYVAGDRALPCRAVPGDGMIPLGRLTAAIEATGFAGDYDLEVIGPRLWNGDIADGLTRGAAHLADLLEQVRRSGSPDQTRRARGIDPLRGELSARGITP